MSGSPKKHSEQNGALHLRPRGALQGQRVSAQSVWHDAHWRFHNPAHGSQNNEGVINWCIDLDDGSQLTNSKHEDLLDWLRRLVWGLVVAPGDGYSPLSPGSMGKLSVGLAHFVPWLCSNRIELPEQLTGGALEQLLIDLPARLDASELNEEDDAELRVTRSTARNALSLPYYIWRQRKSLKQAGINPMPNKPWPNKRGCDALADQISTVALGWIQPLPDEVAVPILNKALEFAEFQAHDILQLRDECARAAAGAVASNRKNAQRRAAENFAFRTLPGSSSAWRPPLLGLTLADGSSGVMVEVRRLLLLAVGACCLVIQAFTGMRVSDLCSLLSGREPGTDLPRGVRRRLSATQLNEEFLLDGKVSKSTNNSQDGRWLLGSRRVGDEEIPAVIKAMLLLDSLLAPYRKMIGAEQLLVTPTNPRGLPRNPKSVKLASLMNINWWYRKFIAATVDLAHLPDQSAYAIEPHDLVQWRESNGQIFRSHQLRKTYASYVLSVHPDLVPAVKRQFQHLNMAITESAYWGSNSCQIDPIQSITRQLTARLIFAVVVHGERLAGRMGKRLTTYLEQVKKFVGTSSPKVAWARIHHCVDADALEVTHSVHGDCLPILGSQMACWKRAGVRPLAGLYPNILTRESSLCASCGCFVVSEVHASFWCDRYVAYWLATRVNSGVHGAQHRELLRRMQQAGDILRALGYDDDALRLLEFKAATKSPEEFRGEEIA